MSSKIERLVDKLRCNDCSSGMSASYSPEINQFLCNKCGTKYSVLNNQIVCLELENQYAFDFLDKLKFTLKRYPNVYKSLVSVMSAVSNTGMKRVMREIKISSPDLTILNVGSGSQTLRKDIVNLDLTPYSSVDVVCSAESLPLISGSVDVIFTIATLEHVAKPISVVEEFQRVLKPNGLIIGTIPFMQGVHASPWDYQRFTDEGLHVLFEKFKVIEIRGYGPTSALLWIAQEFFSEIFSFGNSRLRTIIWIVLQPITFFFKYLDLILDTFSKNSNIPSYYFFKVQKL